MPAPCKCVAAGDGWYAGPVHLQNHSHWHPYLSLVLGSMQPGPPMLWGEAERGRLLGGTGLEEKVAGDLERIENDFRNVVLPFMQRHLREFRWRSRAGRRAGRRGGRSE